MTEKLMDSFGVRDAGGKLTNAGALLADIFGRLGYMERQGSGLGKITGAYENAANYEPELSPKFFSNRVCFIVTLWNLNFKASQDGALNGTLNDALGEEDVKLISLLRTEPSVTQVLAAEKLGFSKRKVQRMMKSS